MHDSFDIRLIRPEDTYALRHQVLWPDKPLAYVKIEDDSTGYHFGAFRQEELVAVISLFVENETARFRKFATRPDCQGQGIGSALLRHVFGEARRLGAARIWCDARQDSAGFYARFGLRPEGETFYKGPVAYVRMAVAL
ncbi:GNAT family N-acetyltransferase [Microvirga sp. STS02]|uniref:GNAT family N-acetyltransferase n=1 Tax=Hymenobacter negativus TaxID=2795026 RepID=UPI0018DE4814|nr:MULTISPECIES: GNAT family N-acetyltransferase [Bacteria]MBH8570715.1 GNAT family N-acetyltransferase [Hymenobacter negativus]MBR7210452.1 GNAT family N-acetyltransferase [Microvirga sp. STS02]